MIKFVCVFSKFLGLTSKICRTKRFPLKSVFYELFWNMYVCVCFFYAVAVWLSVFLWFVTVFWDVWEIKGGDTSNMRVTAVFYHVLYLPHGSAQHCSALQCIAVHFTALHCTTLHCTAMHCTALHYTELHCNTLHCNALHCIVENSICVLCVLTARGIRSRWQEGRGRKDFIVAEYRQQYRVQAAVQSTCSSTEYRKTWEKQTPWTPRSSIFWKIFR